VGRGGRALFRGINAINLDAKGRLAVPSKYRDRLREHCEGQLIVTVDRDRCLLIYPLPEWEVIERKLASLPNLDAQTRRLQRLLIGYATECVMDGHSRILLPPPLREFAALEKRIVVIGQGEKFELWDEQQWNNRCTEWLAVDDAASTLSVELESLTL